MKSLRLLTAALLLGTSAAASAQAFNDTNRGSVSTSGANSGGSGTAAGNYIVGWSGPNRDFFVFNLAGLSPSATSASLIFNYPLGFNSGSGPLQLNLFDYSSSIPALINGTSGATEYNDLGSGVLYGSATVPISSTSFSVTLNSAALAAINGSAGGQFVIGGALNGFSSPDGSTFLFGNTLDAPPVVLSVSAAVPEPATWAMMLMGFGGIGFAMRRRRRAVLAQVA